MWLENFKNNGCPQVLKLGASRVTVSKVEKNKAIVMTLFENKSLYTNKEMQCQLYIKKVMIPNMTK